MEKICILMDKYIKDKSVQKRFKSYLEPFVMDEECVREEEFISELRSFLEEYPEMKDAISID